MDQLQINYHECTTTLAPAGREEQMLCFTQRDQDIEQACIGHLRGDFGSGGTGFFTSWWPHNNELKTDAFKCELDELVTGLRQNGLLADRATMQAHCCRHTQALIKTQSRQELAFRADTEQHTYFLRCIPGKGDYNFYLYCYNRDALMEVLRQRKGLPEMCWSVNKTSHEIIIIRYGELGYYRWDNAGYEDLTPRQAADFLNDHYGITKAQEQAMSCGSMFGWSIPAANAHNYDRNGHLLPDTEPAAQER